MKFILNTRFISLILDKIEKIMDEEMAKEPNEMNGNLVDACAYILSKAYLEK